MVGLLALVFDAPLTELELRAISDRVRPRSCNRSTCRARSLSCTAPGSAAGALAAQVERISLGHGAGLAQHFLPVGLVHALRAAKLL